MPKNVDLSKLVVCKRCGALVADARLHQKWHEAR